MKVSQSLIIDALRKARIDLRAGLPYNVDAVKDAARVIKQTLESLGQVNSQVEPSLEHINSMSVKVVFAITP